jgi:uncharacterized protein YjbI with pentapeptide repeats
MRIKNLTPFLVGYKATSRRPPRPEMTLVVRAAFVLRPGAPLAVPEGALSQGMLTSEVYRDDDEDRAGECLYPGDFADFKLRADVLLKGACHTPQGKPLRECPVRFAVGGWSKILRVVGARRWSGSGAASPEPFTTMPIDYAHAFGGPGYAPNPVGRGFGTEDLPNVERPGQVVRSRDDRPEPAGFGPVSPAWPERRGKVGKDYGPRWRKERAPYFAEDFDWSYFQAAPVDQQLDRYLRGDEEIAFQNLHPAAELFSARLPGLRVRAFVDDASSRLREIELHLDTLLASLGEERLYLTWRGVEPVGDPELRDVRMVLVASEAMDAAPLPLDHYRALFEAAERDPLGVDEHVPEDRRDLARAVLYGERKGVAEPREELDPVSAALRAKLGSSAQAEQQQVRRSIEGMIAAAPPRAGLAAALAAAVNDGGASPKPRSGGAIVELRNVVQRLRRERDEGRAAHPDLDKLEAIAKDPRLARAGAGAAPPVEPGPGVDLTGQDLSGRDLRGRDLKGANLSRAILVGTKLGGAILRGANLTLAVMHGADLEGADLTGADLTTASLGQARARGAILRGAKLDRAVLQQACLIEATFDGASGREPVFEGADLTRATLREVDLTTGLFARATLHEADFTRARLVKCAMLAAAAARAIFASAVLTETTFGGSDLTGAIFVEAQGEGAIWLGATLEGADFSYASLPRAVFIDANAARARFFRAHLAEARFYRAKLVGAIAVQAGLFRADLMRADLTDASLSGALLFEAKLHETVTRGCDFTGVDLGRTIGPGRHA